MAQINETMIQQLMAAVGQIARVLREDKALRQSLSELGRSLAKLVSDPSEDAGAGIVEPAVQPPAEPAGSAAGVEAPPPAAPVELPPLLWTDNALRVDERLRPSPQKRPPKAAAASARPAVEPAPAAPPIDVPAIRLLAARFAVKADGCAWHIRRQELLRDPRTDFETMIAVHDRAIIDRARNIEGGCWMWMCQPHAPTPEPAVMEMTRRCYENVASAIEAVCATIDEHGPYGDELEAAVALLAEAQSALRSALKRCGDVESQDHDQDQLHHWLKRVTRTCQIYIPRHMRLDDPADPANWGDLAERIDALSRKREQVRLEQSQRKSLLKRIAYHGEKLAAGDGDLNAHAARIVESVEDLVGGGLQPSSVELRDLLLPIADLLPDDLEIGPGMRRAMQELDRYLSSREYEVPPPAAQETPEVAAVRSALSGRAVMLIGGEERRQAADRLRAAFGLCRLDWQSTRVHESHFNFRPAVERPDVAVVLLAIRWSSHSFGEVSDFCRETGKPLVRLPGGYNPNQVATQIIRQAGQQLGIPVSD